jgi:SAM-dependent methyltransferase
MNSEHGSKLEFWNNRALTAEYPGSDDWLLKNIELNFLINRVPSEARVLDIGCGDGETFFRLIKDKNVTGVGIDFSQQMINKAARRLDVMQKIGGGVQLVCDSVLNLDVRHFGLFDVVYTQRCLINLDSLKKQTEAVHKIADLLKQGGIYVMIEATNDGLDKTNAIRSKLDLEAIEVPWHNLFFNVAEVYKLQTENFKIEEFHHISSLYYFLSRCIYAKLAQQRNEKLIYGSEINLLSLHLPQEIGEFGPVKGWIWRKS